jgi:D-proline reductase (dithiol) PrdB
MPNDVEFQKRVLRACLGLLDADSGPVLEDYPEDIPADAASDYLIGLSCPIDLPSVPSNDSELTQSLMEEIGQIAPWYDLAVNQRQRTTVGISELDIEDAGRFLMGFIEDPASPSPRPEVEVGPMLKYACEDLKAFYSEAMSAQPGMSTSLAVENWLWNETVLGKILWNFREDHVDDSDAYVGYLAKRGLIPDRQIQYRGAPVF